jgi:uncharacterized protein with PIN domain
MIADGFLRHFRGHKTPLVTQNRTLSFRASPVENESASVNVPAAKEEPPIAAPTQRADSSETNQKNPNTLEEDGNVMADNSAQNRGYFVISKEALEKKIDASLETLNRLAQHSSQSDQDQHRHGVVDMLDCPTCGPIMKSLVFADEDSIADDLAKVKHLHNVDDMLGCPTCRPKVLLWVLLQLINKVINWDAESRSPAESGGKNEHRHVQPDVLACPECRKTLLDLLEAESKDKDDGHRIHSDVDSLLRCPYCGPQVVLAVNRIFNRDRGDTAT